MMMNQQNQLHETRELCTTTSDLNPEALYEISRLQDDILETLRNELKKLKDPVVIGASNVSTPTYEIGQDMTPLPSVRGSAIGLLKPIRVFSPVSPRRKASKKSNNAGVDALRRKAAVSSVRNSVKYDYKARNYPRPWADAPVKKRTASAESLEVHVTTSHFSDLSTMSTMGAAEATPNVAVTASHVSDDVEMTFPVTSVLLVAPSDNAADTDTSVELWKKSVMLNKVSSKAGKYSVKSKITLPRDLHKLTHYQPQARTEVNYVFNHSNSRYLYKQTPKAVVFPDPVSDSEGLKYYVQKQKHSWELGSCHDSNNNNADPTSSVNFEQKPACISDIATENISNLNQSNSCRETICNQLVHSKSVQASCLFDKESQTDSVNTSFSSEFELGLFVATLLDEMLKAACDTRVHVEIRKNSRRANRGNDLTEKDSRHKYKSRKEGRTNHSMEKRKRKDRSVMDYMKTHGSLKLRSFSKNVAAKSSRVLEEILQLNGSENSVSRKWLYLRGTKSTSNSDTLLNPCKNVSTRRLVKQLLTKLMLKHDSSDLRTLYTYSKKSSIHVVSDIISSMKAESQAVSLQNLQSLSQRLQNSAGPKVNGNYPEYPNARTHTDLQIDTQMSRNALSVDPSMSRSTQLSQSHRKKRSNKRKLRRVKGEESGFVVRENESVSKSNQQWLEEDIETTDYMNNYNSINGRLSIPPKYVNTNRDCAFTQNLKVVDAGAVSRPQCPQLQYFKLLPEAKSAQPQSFQFIPPMNLNLSQQQDYINKSRVPHWTNPPGS